MLDLVIFELVGRDTAADADRTVATALGAKRGSSFLPNKRITFVIDTDRKVIGVIKSELSMQKHADQALDVLRQRSSV